MIRPGRIRVFFAGRAQDVVDADITIRHEDEVADGDVIHRWHWHWGEKADTTWCGATDSNHDCPGGYYSRNPVVTWPDTEVCPGCGKPLCPYCRLLSAAALDG